MPISSTHPLYDEHVKTWKKCRDVSCGEHAVKKAGETYLPIPGGLKAEYDNYKMRALFYGAFRRTVQGFVGAIARKDPTIEMPTQLEPLQHNAGGGISLNELIKIMCGECITLARGGLLVDFDEKTQLPYLAIYKCEDVTNWFDDCIVLHETVFEPDPDDRFKRLPVEQYRQLELVNGAYTVTVWRRKKDAVKGVADEWEIYAFPDGTPNPMVPHARGVTFDAIPFFWLTPLGNTDRIEAPPLLELADVCLSHYRSSADLEHGRHFSGLPTLYVAGYTDREGGTGVQVGSMAALLLESPQAKAGYAEVQGDFGSLQHALEEKQQMMAVLGASVFDDTGPRGVEAAETARIRTSGETSLLMGVTTAVEATLKSALECAAKWASVGGTKVEVTLNREFIDTTIDGPTLTGLVQAYQAGALSLSQFLYNLQQGDMLAPDTDLDEEKATVIVEADQRAQKAADLAAKSKPAVK